MLGTSVYQSVKDEDDMQPRGYTLKAHAISLACPSNAVESATTTDNVRDNVTDLAATPPVRLVPVQDATYSSIASTLPVSGETSRLGLAGSYDSSTSRSTIGATAVLPRDHTYTYIDTSPAYDYIEAATMLPEEHGRGELDGDVRYAVVPASASIPPLLPPTPKNAACSVASGYSSPLPVPLTDTADYLVPLPRSGNRKQPNNMSHAVVTTPSTSHKPDALSGMRDSPAYLLATSASPGQDGSSYI